ncbi:hypothetical protein F8B43_5274 [Methylorubrum populi]|uniref:Uncharacterized protein n=1 Tax=Methylorubrum populi TaxID=223967 RepID=A0A833N1X6_9HYPH|nr:hypothetical protein F8B43_5274 [Methylorubrum populi]
MRPSVKLPRDWITDGHASAAEARTTRSARTLSVDARSRRGV